MDLAGFLAARLDEDEAVAKTAGADAWHGDAHSGLYHEDVRNQPGAFAAGAYEVFLGGEEVHILRHDPARVLREVEAKRAIVRWHPSEPMRNIDASRCPQCELTWPCPTIRVIAAVYSDHPGYRQEWAP